MTPRADDLRRAERQRIARQYRAQRRARWRTARLAPEYR